jgi:hypothetical protein
MKNKSPKWWLGVATFILLTPLLSIAQPGHDHHGNNGCNGRDRDCLPVPEGGSSMVYILGAGVTCLGAVFVRSRLAKSV